MNNKNITSVLVFSSLALPAIAYSASGLIPCDGPNCGFNDLIVLANTIIKFLMFSVAVPLAAIGFAWRGADLILNPNKEGAWSKATTGFTDIAIGFGIMLGAYVLIKTVLYSFLNTQAGYFTFLVG